MQTDEELLDFEDALYVLLRLEHATECSSLDGVSVRQLSRRKPFSWRLRGSLSFLIAGGTSHEDVDFHARIEPDSRHTDLRSYEIHFSDQSIHYPHRVPAA